MPVTAPMQFAQLNCDWSGPIVVLRTSTQTCCLFPYPRARRGCRANSPPTPLHSLKEGKTKTIATAWSTALGSCLDPDSAIIAKEKMTSVAKVERKIRRVEGFAVRILHLNGADVRGDKTGLPQYGYHRAAEKDITVKTWKLKRFQPSYPGFRVDVVDARGNSVQGNTKLDTVRASYRKR